MRSIIMLAPLALLAACATPQQQCLDAAAKELRVNTFLIGQTQANLERGYALDRQQRLRRGFDRCRVRNGDGTVSSTLCPVTKVRTVNVPEAINLDVERATLDQLLARRAVLERQSAAAVAQCRALYPE